MKVSTYKSCSCPINWQSLLRFRNSPRISQPPTDVQPFTRICRWPPCKCNNSPRKLWRYLQNCVGIKWIYNSLHMKCGCLTSPRVLCMPSPSFIGLFTHEVQLLSPTNLRLSTQVSSEFNTFPRRCPTNCEGISRILGAKIIAAFDANRVTLQQMYSWATSIHDYLFGIKSREGEAKLQVKRGAFQKHIGGCHLNVW